jgi:3-oxoacyl-[acyl-carrier protein] reductase
MANILITGGASGLGAAAVTKLANNLDNLVYFTYARSKHAAMALQNSAPNICAIHCNFTDEASISALIEQMPGLELQVLINNAVTGFQNTYFHKTPVSEFADSFARNVIPVIRITRQFITLCRKQRYGKIINIITSAVINKPPIGWSEYVANKAYLLSLSNSWAAENAAYNITSNAISPAFMLTGLTSATDDRIVEQMVQQHPLKALLTTSEVADSIAYFTTCSQQVNGVNFVINAASNIV